MRRQHRIRRVLLLAGLALGVPFPSVAGDIPESVVLPTSVTALEGRPTVIVTSDGEGTERRVLTAEEARRNRLRVTVIDGRFFWASRENRPLGLTTSGAFSYLTGGPGSYVKFARYGTRIVYMEHATILLSTITYWGELDVLAGR
jgi:hypothetical protein